MSIYSLVIHTKPENMEFVSSKLQEIEAVELHGQNEKGKIVVLIDHPDRVYCSSTIMDFHSIPGVLNTSLIYEYFEDDDEDFKNIELTRQSTTREASLV